MSASKFDELMRDIASSPPSIAEAGAIVKRTVAPGKRKQVPERTFEEHLEWAVREIEKLRIWAARLQERARHYQTGDGYMQNEGHKLLKEADMYASMARLMKLRFRRWLDPASAIEARRATTAQTGVVEDESAVPKADAQ